MSYYYKSAYDKKKVRKKNRKKKIYYNLSIYKEKRKKGEGWVKFLDILVQ